MGDGVVLVGVGTEVHDLGGADGGPVGPGARGGAGLLVDGVGGVGGDEDECSGAVTGDGGFADEEVGGVGELGDGGEGGGVGGGLAGSQMCPWVSVA